MQFFTGKKNLPLNLKAELQKLIFVNKEPKIVCEDQATFVMVMSTFMNYEKNVSILYQRVDRPSK